MYGFGSGRTCPVCGWSGSQFLPFGVRQRPDAACPGCGAKERHRLLWEYLTRELTLEGPSKLLYVAPVETLEGRLRGMGSVAVTTVDVAKRAPDVKADVTGLPFRDGAYDAILCSHVLEHVPEDERALSELYRVLEPGGWCLVVVPQDRSRERTCEDETLTTDAEREAAFGQDDHLRLYGADFERRLRSAGFDVSIIDYSDELGSEAVERHGLREHDRWRYDHTVLFHCKKSEDCVEEDAVRR